MDIQEVMVWVIPFLTVANIVITWLNSKSKKDIASATEMAEVKSDIKELRKELDDKVDMVKFTEMMGDIKNIAGMIRKLEGDMHSVLNDSGINANQLAKDQTRLDSIDNRLSLLESKILINK